MQDKARALLFTTLRGPPRTGGKPHPAMPQRKAKLGLVRVSAFSGFRRSGEEDFCSSPYAVVGFDEFDKLA